MVKISVIIPAKNEEAFIGKALESIGDSAECEVIVATNCTDRTASIAEEYGARVVRVASKFRSEQMNMGAKKAQGDILVFLHPDTVLPAGALSLVAEAMDDILVVGGGFHLAFDHDHWFLRTLAYWANVRVDVKQTFYGDQTIFVRRAVFANMGGFKKMQLFEDVDFSNRLKKVGKLRFLDEKSLTSSRRFLRTGMYKQWMINCMCRGLYVLGASDATLYRMYNRLKK